MKVLFISTALPRETSAGELLLYRHFSQLPNLDLTVAGDPTAVPIARELIPLELHPLMAKLMHSRFSRFAHDINQCILTAASISKLRNLVKREKFDVISTVAEGYHWKLALQTASEFNLPLATFFHDWWPSMCFVHSGMRAFVEREFIKLARKSTIAFCISDGMKEALGPGVKSEVIYPIPGFANPAAPVTRAPDQRFEIIYAGALWHPYARLLEQFTHAMAEAPNLSLKLFGRDPGKNGNYISKLPSNVTYEGFKLSPALLPEFAGADALLVVISFDPKDKKWSETSFPSKLVEYCQQGRPILIWGPEYSAAIQWAKKYDAALPITSANAADAVRAFQQLAGDAELRTRLIRNARATALGDFDPKTIQQRFEAALNSAVYSS